MKVAEQIAQHLIDVHEGDNWTEVNIRNTLSDVSIEEAKPITAISANSIAALLHHITFYSNIIIERLKGNDREIGEANGFDVPPLQGEADWLQLKEENMRAAHNLATVIRQLPDEKLHEPILPGKASVYKTLHGVIEHAHYHLGQIVLIKKCLKHK